MNFYFMTVSKVQELFKQEHNNWLKKLELLQMEIVFLKNHVGQIVQKEVDIETLEKLEIFQTNFLNKDMIIALLRRDIKAQGDLLLDRKAFENEVSSNLIYKKQDILRSDIGKLELELIKIKTEFKKLQLL